MFKRANKITALLVAAASVMSIVPAMAADTTRLGTKEGTIENAVAFKDGKYAYEGYKTNSDDKSVYYNAGDKDKELTALTDANLSGSYSDKYAFAVDGNDEYLVDLTDGKVIDDETPADKEDTAATKLKTALKKTDRYGDAIVLTANELVRIGNGPSFGDVWYKYQANPTDGDFADNDVTINGDQYLFGYTDASGKYIDVSNVANVYAYSTAKQKVVKIDNFSNKINDEDSDTKLQATLLEAPEFLAQDKEFIYQKVKVQIQDKYATAAANTTTAKVNFNNAGTTVAAAAPTGIAATADIALTLGIVGDTIVFNGTTYTNAAIPGTATEYKDLATLVAAINAKDTIYTVSADGKKVTADAVGVQATLKSGTGVVVTNFVNGTEPGTAVKASSFKIGKVTLNYSATSAAADLTTYKSSSDLKDKVNKLLATGGITQFVNTLAGASYDSSTQMFTLADAGAEFTDANATTLFTTAVGNKIFNKTYIQKISKAQGDTKDDAYLPKTVASYELSKNYFDCGDGDDAFDHVADANDWTVINGTLAAVRDNHTNVRVTPINLKKDKVKFDGAYLPAELAADDKVDVYLAEKGDDGDTDVVSTGTPYSIDVNGDVWAINEGKIKKFVIGSDFKDQFTADRSLDSINVYDEKNLIAWDASGDVYTAVNEGTKVTQAEATLVAPVVVTNNWVKGTDGTWTFNDATGTKIVSKWINYGGAWYYLKADGVMATGWTQENGTWYYLAGSGAMKTGWVNDNGTWYYLATSGAMLANTTVDGYVLGASGAWVK